MELFSIVKNDQHALYCGVRAGIQAAPLRFFGPQRRDIDCNTCAYEVPQRLLNTCINFYYLSHVFSGGLLTIR